MHLRLHCGVVPQIKRMEMEARSFSADRSRTLLVKVRPWSQTLPGRLSCVTAHECRSAVKPCNLLLSERLWCNHQRRHDWGAGLASAGLPEYGGEEHEQQSTHLRKRANIGCICCITSMHLSTLRRAGQVREYKADLAKLQESSKGAAASASGGAAARAELGLHDDYAQTSGAQRDRLLQTTEKLGRTGERITQGRQQLLETEVRLFLC